MQSSNKRISKALRMLASNSADGLIQKWFGKHTDEAKLRKHVTKILSGALAVLGNAVIRSNLGDEDDDSKR